MLCIRLRKMSFLNPTAILSLEENYILCTYVEMKVLDITLRFIVKRALRYHIAHVSK